MTAPCFGDGRNEMPDQEQNTGNENQPVTPSTDATPQPTPEATPQPAAQPQFEAQPQPAAQPQYQQAAQPQPAAQPQYQQAAQPQPAAQPQYQQAAQPQYQQAAQPQYQGTPAPQYQTAPAYGQTPYTPQPAANNGFALNVVGLILSFLQLCIPGLICNIIGFSKANKAKKAMTEERPGDNTKSSWVVGLIGLIMGGLFLVLQIIITIVFGAIIVAAINSDNGTTDTTDSLTSIVENGGSSTSTSMQTIGSSDIGYIEIPSTWVTDIPNGEGDDGSEVISYGDPNSGDEGFYGTYSSTIEMTGYYLSQDEAASKIYDYVTSDSKFSNVQQRTTTINGKAATVISYSFTGTSQQVREYVVEYAEGECTDIYVEANSSKIGEVSKYAESFKTSSY